MREKPWRIIGRGFNGWHAEAPDVSLSGAYGEDACNRLAAEAEDGALVYDAKHAARGPFVELVMNGPMCCTKMPPDEYEGLDEQDRERLAALAPALGGGFRTLAVVAQNRKFSGLDRVGVNVYEALLRKIPGVKFGRVRKGVIEWEPPEPLTLTSQ